MLTDMALINYLLREEKKNRVNEYSRYIQIVIPFVYQNFFLIFELFKCSTTLK